MDVRKKSPSPTMIIFWLSLNRSLKKKELAFHKVPLTIREQ